MDLLYFWLCDYNIVKLELSIIVYSVNGVKLYLIK